MPYTRSTSSMVPTRTNRVSGERIQRSRTPVGRMLSIMIWRLPVASGPKSMYTLSPSAARCVGRCVSDATARSRPLGAGAECCMGVRGGTCASDATVSPGTCTTSQPCEAESVAASPGSCARDAKAVTAAIRMSNDATDLNDHPPAPRGGCPQAGSPRRYRTA